MNARCWLPERSRLRGRSGDRSALFLDRDGVLVEDMHFLKRTEQVCLIEHAVEPLRALQERYVLVVATNQSGIARGFLDEDTLKNINRRVVEQLADRGVQLDCVYYCPHHPDAIVAAYRLACGCRKPAPGMLLQAAIDWGLDLTASCMVGDRLTDLEAGHAAGARSFLIPPDTRADAWARLATYLL